MDVEIVNRGMIDVNETKLLTPTNQTKPRALAKNDVTCFPGVHASSLPASISSVRYLLNDPRPTDHLRTVPWPPISPP